MMRGEYRIFRVFCVFSIVIMCMLLTAAGILTAKNKTEQTVLGRQYDVVQVYEKAGGTVINVNGWVTGIDQKEIKEKFDMLSHTVFAPFDNVIELVKTVSGTEK